MPLRSSPRYEVIIELEINKAESELREFMRTDEWFMILGILGISKKQLCVHSYDDVCSMHEAIYLTSAGFINHRSEQLNNINEIVSGFMGGYFYGADETHAPTRHPSMLIPWIKGEVKKIKER